MQENYRSICQIIKRDCCHIRSVGSNYRWRSRGVCIRTWSTGKPELYGDHSADEAQKGALVSERGK